MRRSSLVRAVSGLAGAAMMSALLFPASQAAGAELVAADDGAKIVARTQLDDRTFDLTVSSPALAESVQVRVLVPKGWSQTAARTWPVVYAYQGGRDTYVSWTRSTDIEEVSAKYDVMVVMPEGDNGSYTDWWNYGKGGTPKWETFHTREVLQLMERNFRAGATGKKRAVMGISSGASGAITYAARHPGMFGYAVSSSGVLHLTQPGIPAMTMFVNAFFGDGGDPYRIWGIPGIDTANWKAHDPYELANNLRGTGLYISSGTTGLPGPYDSPEPGHEKSVQFQEVLCGSTTISFIARLKELGIPATTHVYENGWHNWEAWQPEMHRYWPAMMTTIGARPLA
ncbi:alpha/beta hydrolase [Actinomadura scrupuli]|uniref:alpha/beta hydrolase n=1 Tax=Actinomadura scrupuli TaxID=559629 RepID=UPI003D95A8E4